MTLACAVSRITVRRETRLMARSSLALAAFNFFAAAFARALTFFEAPLTARTCAVCAALAALA